MANRTRRPLLLAAFLLLLPLPTVSVAQYEEYETSVFESWLAGAPCEALEAEELFLRKSLASSKQGVRRWKMDLRVQLGHAHRRFARRCIDDLRYWSYECLSIRRAIRVLRHALEDDELMIDAKAERRTLTRRRKKIEERYARACESEALTGGG